MRCVSRERCFVILGGGGECRFRFDYAMPGTFPYAYQVLRSSFDTDLAAAAEGESAVFHFGPHSAKLGRRPGRCGGGR